MPTVQVPDLSVSLGTYYDNLLRAGIPKHLAEKLVLNVAQYVDVWTGFTDVDHASTVLAKYCRNLRSQGLSESLVDEIILVVADRVHSAAGYVR